VTNLLRSEWIKVRSVRSTIVLLVAAGALTILFTIIAANDKRDHTTFECQGQTTTQTTDTSPDGGFSSTGACPDGVVEVPVTSHLGDVTVGVQVAIFLFGILGVQIIGQEYRFNTIRPTFTAAPRRLRVLVAKLVVITVAAAAVSVVMLAVSAAIGSVMLQRFEIDGVDIRVIWATILFAMGWTAYGMGLGAIMRQPIAAIVVLVVQGLIAEALLANTVHALGPWMPFLNGIQMTGREPNDQEIFRSIFAGGVYFFAVTAVVWAIGAYLVNKRDA
jgi:ABC-2 type transport system permease protein